MKQAKCDQEKWNKAINHAQRVLEIVGKEADGGWRCGPVRRLTRGVDRCGLQRRPKPGL